MNSPCQIIAEIGNAHNGDLARAIRLLTAAKRAGATAAKFQCYSVEELIALRGDGPAPEPWNDRSMRDLYAQAMTPQAWFPTLIAHCEAIKLPWFSSVFGSESLALMESLDCPRYKLAALDFGVRWLREAVEGTRKPVIRSCAHELAPPGYALKMYCPPGYPQAEWHLRNIRNGYDGFSYHGTDPNVPVIAVACGATMIECHFHLADEPSALESNVSLNEYQFNQMVYDIRRTEAMLA